MITACFDLTGGWTFTGDPSTMFAVCITDGDADPFYPDGFGFGWTVTANGIETGTHGWPAENAVVREMSSQRMFEFPVNANGEVVLAVWATESGQRIEGQTTFVVPRPAQPFPSWTWEDGSWTAPVPYPDDGNYFVWDEDSQGWVMLDPAP